MVRGEPISIFYCKTKNDLIVPGIMSLNKGGTVLKMFNLNRFSVLIKK